LLEVFRRQRPGEPVNRENAENLVQSLFFDPKRYDLSEVGRYKVNKKLKLDVPLEDHTLTIEDIVGLLGASSRPPRRSPRRRSSAGSTTSASATSSTSTSTSATGAFGPSASWCRRRSGSGCTAWSASSASG
jgi:hypothetical protein